MDPRPCSPPHSIEIETQRLHECIYVQMRIDSLVHLHDNKVDQYGHLATKEFSVSIRVGQTKSLSAVWSSFYLSQLISIFSANILLDCIRQKFVVLLTQAGASRVSWRSHLCCQVLQLEDIELHLQASIFGGNLHCCILFPNPWVGCP